MKTTYALGSLLIATLVSGAGVTADPRSAPHLVPIVTYDTGLGALGAEIISIRHSDGIAVLTNIAGSVDILDLSNPFQPRLLRRVSIGTAFGTPNSAAVHPNHDYFLVAIGTAGATGAVQAYRLSDGSFLGGAALGIQPDSIAIAPNGQHAVVANEAEGVPPAGGGTVGSDGGEGSISIVDLTGFNGVGPGTFSVTTIALPSINSIPGVTSGRTDGIALLSIDNTPARIEPESVAFSPNSRFAYLTLQENNAVVRVDVRTAELTFFGLGTTTHDADVINGAGYTPTPNALTAFREPDGIAIDQTGRFFVTADEGDTNNATGGGSVRGGRTLSVFDAETGQLLGDTGGQIDAAAAAEDPTLYPGGRSNRGGSEPEGVDLTHHRGFTLAAVTLERANAVALVDVSSPTAPVVIDVQAVGTGPEGIKFFRAGNRLFVATPNEVSGTVSILEVVF
jgi:uncharacterized protein